jgi:hypothetical protein
VSIPRVAPKFIKFLRARRSVYREIAAMAALEHHDNVLDLFEVLELVEDSKATLFLVLEMATGGELFDRCGAPLPPYQCYGPRHEHFSVFHVTAFPRACSLSSCVGHPPSLGRSCDAPPVSTQNQD